MITNETAASRRLAADLMNDDDNPGLLYFLVFFAFLFALMWSGSEQMMTTLMILLAPAASFGFVVPSGVGRMSAPRRFAAAPSEGFTMVGADGKTMDLTLAEKERIFVDAMQSFYYSGKQMLSDTEFDQLKEDLMWEGSEYAMLSRNETRFLNAIQYYGKGAPIMTDEEFDDLKQSLKAQNSIVATSKEPRCFLDTGVCSVTFAEDPYRKLVLYVPAFLVLSVLWTGGVYELVPAVRQINPLLYFLVGTPVVAAIAQFVTEKIIFSEPLIATGPCPNCNVNNRIFFGNILGVDGPGESAEVNCVNCATKLTISRDTLRVSTPAKTP